MDLPAWRSGKPYESPDRDSLVHFLTGEPVAEVSQIGRVPAPLRLCARPPRAPARVRDRRADHRRLL